MIPKKFDINFIWTVAFHKDKTIHHNGIIILRIALRRSYCVTSSAYREIEKKP